MDSIFRAKYPITELFMPRKTLYAVYVFARLLVHGGNQALRGALTCIFEPQVTLQRRKPSYRDVKGSLTFMTKAEVNVLVLSTLKTQCMASL